MSKIHYLTQSGAVYNIIFSEDSIDISLSKHNIVRIIEAEHFSNLYRLDFSLNKVNEIYLPESFKNLTCLRLHDNVIKKISGMNNLLNLRELDLRNNKISEIEGIDVLHKLEVLVLSNNQIKKIKNLQGAFRLQDLYLDGNNIREIKNLETLWKLKFLDLCRNKISKINGLKNQRLKTLKLRENYLSKIKHLDSQIELKHLDLGYNRIVCIENLENLCLLEELVLCGTYIINVKNIDKLINLRILNLENCYIEDLRGIRSLKNLIELNLADNIISDVSDLSGMLSLQKLDLRNNYLNKIQLDIPSLRKINIVRNPILEISKDSLEKCKNLEILTCNNGIIIHQTIQEIINKNTILCNKLKIYRNGENVHENTINKSIIDSIKRLRSGRTIRNLSYSEITNDPILTIPVKQIILTSFNDNCRHSIVELTYYDLFSLIWDIICEHPSKDVLKMVMNQEILDGAEKCLTGKMSRLVNVLSGFDDRVDIKISDTDEISNIIIMLKKKYSDVDILRKIVTSELVERGYDTETINNWIIYIQ